MSEFGNGRRRPSSPLRLLTLGVVLAALAVLLPSSIASASSYSTANKDSCVMSFSGTTLTPAFTWSNGSTRTVRVKCHYSGRLHVGPFGTNPAPFDGTVTPSSSWNFYWSDDGTGMHVAAGSGSVNFTWSNYTLIAHSTTLDYVEFSVDVKRWSGTTKSQAAKSFVWVGWDTDPAAGLTQDYLLGSNTVATCEGCGIIGDSGYATTDTGYYYGGSYWTPVPDPFCEELIVGVVDAGATVLHGDEWEMVLTATGYTAVPSTVTLHYRWSAVDPWRSYVPPLLHSLPLATDVLNDTLRAVVPAAGFEVRCTDTDEPGDTWYVQPDGAGADADPQPIRACSVVSITWPSFPLHEGDTYSFGFRVGPGVPGPSFGVEALSVGFEEDYTSTELVEPTGWQTLGVIPSTESWPAFTGDAGTLEITVPDTAHPIWAQGEVFIVCEDAYGTVRWRSGSLGNGVYRPPVDSDEDSYADRYTECVSDQSIGFNPASWAPWLINASACLLQVLFVPLQSDVDELQEDAEAASEKAPISYLTEVGGELVDVFGGTPSQVLAHEDDCIGLMNDEPNMGDVSICPSELGGGSIGPWRTAVGILFWFGALWALFSVTKRVVSK